MSERDRAQWDRWFDIQYDLCQEIDKLLTETSKGLPPIWRTSLALAVIEHLAEHARLPIELPAPVSVSVPTEETDG